MTDEINNEVQSPDVNYIEAINQLKQTTVSRDEYNRVLNDNKRMVELMLNNTPNSTEEVVSVPTDEEITAMRKKLYTSDSALTNLEYISETLKLRKALMDKGGRDPFLPVNHNYVDNDADRAAAQEYADKLQQMVDYSNGDPEVFNSELKRCCK